eukprot:TRINITY_DN7969_c0_g2_i2.p1 TRINITY_DN7969_c0_g2~~TRINITY_DN7969_c0_g2_i2.p1  ORF type:complete len:142 (+),score=33.58 TRINITY_DN7969_c0_g2_i2:117-542(+)
MGKENHYLLRTKPNLKAQSNSFSKPNHLKELAKTWSLFNFDSFKNATEDGHILLSIKKNSLLVTIICRGFKSSGNTCEYLVRYLKKQRLIKGGDILRMYSLRGLVWTEEDALEGRFSAGQHILVNVSARSEKAISKISKRE